MFNGCQLSPVNFLFESSPLSSLGMELTLFGYVTGSIQRLYPLSYVSLRTSVYEFLGIINLIMSSVTIFTRAHIATLLLLLLFSSTPYYWFPYRINFYAWSAQDIFVTYHRC